MTELQVHGGGIDQPIPIDENAMEAAFSEVDQIIQHSLNTNDAYYAIDQGKELIRGVQIRGIALSRLLYELWDVWDDFGLSDTFEDIIMAEWGLAKGTIRKYLTIWRNVFANPDVPDEIKPQLYEKPINTLRRLVRPINEGEIDDEDWPRLISAHDDKEFRAVIRDIAGKAPQGRPALVLTINEFGEIRAFMDRKVVTVGVLKNQPHDLKDDLLFKAYDRILRGANIVEQ